MMRSMPGWLALLFLLLSAPSSPAERAAHTAGRPQAEVEPPERARASSPLAGRLRVEAITVFDFSAAQESAFGDLEPMTPDN